MTRSWTRARPRGGGEAPPLLGNHPQLVIGAGGAVLVALLLEDGERLEIPLLGGGEVPPLLGNHPQLVIGRSLSRGFAERPPDRRQSLEEARCSLEAARVHRVRRARLPQPAWSTAISSRSAS